MASITINAGQAMKANYRIITLFAIVFFLTAGNAFGRDSNLVLKGIESVKVSINVPEKYKKNSHQWQRDVELKLRLAGIKLDSSSPQILGVDVLSNELMQGNSNKVIGLYV